ncbi:MAG: glutathionylspermidine synthase family protein [Nostoc sp.]|uniref:glutathionylspermidine synthase family protein n=1 Tax=Nostoc sp. TaxID=1180 RepID=UPI002FF66AF0
MKPPWQAEIPMSATLFEEVRLQTIFDCCKWDPQVEDVATLANFPLLLNLETWLELAQLAEKLASETLAAEQEILLQPHLQKHLNLPPAIQKLWQHPSIQTSPKGVRVIRFDFHFTTEDWRISEANSDVPSGYIEASGFTYLMALHYSQTTPLGNPALALATAIRESVGEGAHVALAHATAYTDDRQVMTYLAQHFQQVGLQTYLISPAQLRWEGGCPLLLNHHSPTSIDFLYRFFPVEWLPNLPKASGWQHLFGSVQIPQCNPTSALITQSKRFPLVWDALKTQLPTWRSLLPETCDPRQVRDLKDEAWVLKPALGRIGENIGILGVTEKKDWLKIQQSAKQHPEKWVAQRRFEIIPLLTAEGYFYPCIGVYTINGRAAGAYGRLGSRPLIDATAQDVAILTQAQKAVGE